jgi:hypothetical protein
MQVRVLPGSPKIRNRCYHHASLFTDSLLTTSPSFTSKQYGRFSFSKPLALVKPICGNQASAKSQRIAECRFGCRRFRSRVSHARRNRITGRSLRKQKCNLIARRHVEEYQQDRCARDLNRIEFDPEENASCLRLSTLSDRAQCYSEKSFPLYSNFTANFSIASMPGRAPG